MSHADAPSETQAHHPMAGQASPASQHQGHSGADDCLMIMACGFVSIRPVPSATMVRFPAILLRTGYSPLAMPVVADLAVEPPPPRVTA